MYYYVQYQSFLSSIIERQTDISWSSASQPVSTFLFCIYPHDVPQLPFTFTMPQNNARGQHKPNEGHLSLTGDRPMDEATVTISPTNVDLGATSISPTNVHTSVPYLVRDNNLKTKKYKPVVQKVRAILGEMPEKFRVMWKIIGDSLKDFPKLSPNLPPFVLTSCYTQEQKEIIEKMNPRFLLPAKCELLHHFMALHQDGLHGMIQKEGTSEKTFSLL